MECENTIFHGRISHKCTRDAVRPVKRMGRQIMACAICASAIERGQRKRDEADKAYEQTEAALLAFERDVALAFPEQPVEPFYARWYAGTKPGPTGKVVVDFEWLKEQVELADRYRDLRDS